MNVLIGSAYVELADLGDPDSRPTHPELVEIGRALDSLQRRLVALNRLSRSDAHLRPLAAELMADGRDLDERYFKLIFNADVSLAIGATVSPFLRAIREVVTFSEMIGASALDY